ncbi:SPOSA6832_00628 [Sporobolomyces salmonicolor]|uniref:SPOSA6832_00628-mRNA-1:cds n=1 Tax=Sporidiobolus salmonicolor TaxID=5005 RepID=A0A0D6EH50_SPOSA|nr:SPOSA6832_00628 [Sporobolomyces salmonicolor]
MHIPPADYIGWAVEGATHYLAKRPDDEAALKLTHTQWVTVYCAELYVIVLLLSHRRRLPRGVLSFTDSFLVHSPIHCAISYPSSHAPVGTLTGAKVTRIMLDPNQGGATRMEGGWPFRSLPRGYIGSSTIGAALIFASFDQKASKIAVIPFVGILLIVSKFTVLNMAFTLGLCVIFLLVEHAAYWRFLLLFIGCMNGERPFYRPLLNRHQCADASTLDGLSTFSTVFPSADVPGPTPTSTLFGTNAMILRSSSSLPRVPSDSRCLQTRSTSQTSAPSSAFTPVWLPAQVCGAIWFLFSCCSPTATATAAILGGIVCFKKDFAEQYLESQTFMPT